MALSTSESTRDTTERRQAEADFFSQTKNHLTRQVAWSAIPYFQKRISERFDLYREPKTYLGDKDGPKALTLACGDMAGEYPLFCRLKVSHIVAYDISEGQRQKFRDKIYDRRVPVDYRLEDVNKIVLDKGAYDIVYMTQSLHHITNIEGVLEQIAGSLTPDGIFLLNDYIGVPFLQRSARQRELSARLWPHLPERLRRTLKGDVMRKPHIPRIDTLSPDEAVRSDAILPALHAVFTPLKEFAFGGLLYATLNGFAQNYTDAPEDMMVLKLLWEVDQFMIETGAIEPNFIRGVYRRASR